MRLKTPARSLLLAAFAVLACLTTFGQRAHPPDSTLTKVEDAGVSFAYRADDYGRMTVRNVERRTAQEAGDEVAPDISPPHRCFDLEDKRPLPALEKGPRYFYPARSTICFIPLADPSVSKFSESYPLVSKAAGDLRRILRRRPRQFGRLGAWGTWAGIPDLPDSNAGPSIVVKPAYLDAPAVSGLLFLTQYSQEMQPNPANNEELTYNFQGLSRDGRYYVAARFSVTHPSLPKGIDFANVERDKKLLYLRRDERKLNRLAEFSFRPSLKTLKALLSSISIK